jgi:FlaA1/EpsC-like NDP-sugar epimerase
MASKQPGQESSSSGFSFFLRDREVTAHLPSLLAKTVGRTRSLFDDDIEANNEAIKNFLVGKRILVTGAAGSIGSSTVAHVLKHKPAYLAAIDLSENNLVELVRDLRSRQGLIVGDTLKTYVVDFGSSLGNSFIKDLGPFDLVLHFAAMKHVRSERDIYSLSRLIETNVLKVDRFLSTLKQSSPCDVFAISTDKACAPANLMGASKNIMEQIVLWHGKNRGSLLGDGDGDSLPRVACTRFANAAFSDGSLLAGFMSRIQKKQPLAGPSDVRRYFITEGEAGQICLLTAALAKSGQIFVPKLDPTADMKTFAEIAEIVLREYGYEPRWYDTEDEAKQKLQEDLSVGAYSCCFARSDTSGEKEFEEFIGPEDILVSSPFSAIDVIERASSVDGRVLKEVLGQLSAVTASADSNVGKQRIVEQLTRAVPSLQHVERERDLDQKM